MNPQQNYIPTDGYTEPGYLAALPGLHGEFRFTFRPMLDAEQTTFFSGTEKLSPLAARTATHTLIASRIVGWSHVDAKSQPIDVTAANVARLKPAIVGRLFGIILGTLASDIDPQWEQVEQSQAAEEQFAALLAGKPVGQVRQESNEKNSDPASG